jgi:hypothetical protein
MMLLSKLAKQREFGPCEHWVLPVPDPHKEKSRRVGEAQEKNFTNDGRNNFWNFSQIIFP